jgi:hypothetical protein
MGGLAADRQTRRTPLGVFLMLLCRTVHNADPNDAARIRFPSSSLAEYRADRQALWDYEWYRLHARVSLTKSDL